jgi:predicted ATPase/class 3 adenylate cyclase
MKACPACEAPVPSDAEQCPECGADVGESQHRLVTVLFCDVVDSSGLEEQLGPEATRHYMDRYQRLAQQVLQGHGGSVGHRRGDGFMTVFGLPDLHDDDALRAVRAAAQFQQELAPLRAEVEEQFSFPLKVRVGVNTGTALVGDGEALEERITGETANLAKRLEAAADPDSIFLGVETFKLVRDAVEVEDREVEVKVRGAMRSLPAYRVLEVLPGRPGRIRRQDRPMIGRVIEQKLLELMFERTLAESRCHLITTLGPAGVGKSRLIEEFAKQLGSRATILRGHCLSYGDSVTFWPIIEIVHYAAGIEPADSPEQVHERLAQLVADEHQADQITLHVAQLLGTSAEVELSGDTPWALRRLLEALARTGPLVVLIEDLQWAEPTLLEALEHIAEHAIDTPILLIGIGRPDELLLRYPHWPSGKLNVTSVQLSPLSDTEAEELIGHLVEGELDLAAQAQITRKAQGNPLILEELTDALMGDGVLHREDGQWTLARNLDDVSLPLSIHALLAGRLERLDDSEREVLERAAIVGEQFHLGDISVLVPGRSSEEISKLLEGLIRHELIRRDFDAAVPLPTESGPGYRFHHILIRNVAYEGMSERLRALLHERYADWLERGSGERIGLFDELIAYHLSKAVDYLAMIPAQGERRRELARRAGMRFASAGRRAAARGDIRPTTSWLDRASQLLPPDDPARLEVLPDLAGALQAGGRLEAAMKVYDEMISAAQLVGAEDRLKHAALGKLHVTAFRDPDRFLREGPDEVQRAIHVFEREKDLLGLAKAYYFLAYAEWAMGKSTAAGRSAKRARAYARDANDKRWEAHILHLRCLVSYWGPAPLDEVVDDAWTAHAIAGEAGMGGLEAAALTILARVAAMRDNIPEARRLRQEANAITHNLGELLTQATDSVSDGLIELLDENLAGAEQVLLKGHRALQGMGGAAPGASIAAMLARVYLEQRRYADAERMAMECKAKASERQFDMQIRWRAIWAVVRARRGEQAEAEPLAKEAVRLALQGDQLESRAEAHAGLAEVLRLAERREEAANELQKALDLYEQKGSQRLAKWVRRELAALPR